MTDSLVVTFPQDEKGRRYIAEALQGAADVVYLADLDDDRARAAALRGATALLARNTAKELRPHEPALIERVKLIQFINAGVDFVPLKVFDPTIPIASNGGAYAEPMAEHALAMVLAAAKRLLVEHEALKRGEFNQGKRNRSLAGGVCGVLGFGGIGVATARLMRALGMKIHAINRRGASDEPTDWIGPPADLDIPRSPENPKILGVDDSEIVGDLVAIVAPFSGHLDAQEVQVPRKWRDYCDEVSANFRIIDPKDFRVLG